MSAFRIFRHLSTVVVAKVYALLVSGYKGSASYGGLAHGEHYMQPSINMQIRVRACPIQIFIHCYRLILVMRSSNSVLHVDIAMAWQKVQSYTVCFGPGFGMSCTGCFA